jgi:hypothetical protein
MLPGVPITIGEREWIVPPLTLGHLRRLSEEVATLSDGAMALTDPKTIDAVVRVVTAALQRNYPDLMEERVADMLDMGNAPAVFMAVMTGSGLKRGPAPPGEASAAGGMSSMASSPPASDIGPGTSTS